MTIRITDASSTGFAWTKSSYSGTQGECIEVARNAIPTALPVRDSKTPTGPATIFSNTAWTGFIHAIKHANLTRQ